MNELLTMDDMIAAYFESSDEIAKTKKRHEAELAGPLKDLAEVESMIHAALLAAGADSVRVASKARAFFQMKTHYNIADKEEYFDWLRSAGDSSFVPSTIIQSAAAEFADAHKGALPPGVGSVSEKKLYVRRS